MASQLQLPPPTTILPSLQHLNIDRPKIPLVGHIITDEDVGVLEGVKLLPVSLSKVAKLLTDPHSVQLYDRHIHALKKVVRHYQDGFLLKDLVSVLKILNVCADRSQAQPIYLAPMIDLLKICSLPFLKEKTSDEKVYEQIAVDSMTQIGYLMRVSDDNVRRQICQTLISLYDDKIVSHKVQGLKGTEPSYNRAVIEKSDVAQIIVKSLQLIGEDKSMILELTKLLQKLSKNSAENCSKMLSADAAKVICSHLTSHGQTGELVFRSVEVLWNLLQFGEGERVAHQLNNLQCISQLQETFLYQLTSGYSAYDRQLRNDLLVILCLIATHCPTAPFIEAQFSRQLVLLATFQEIKSHQPLVKHLKLTTCQEDFELKKLIINMIVSLSCDHAILRQYAEGRLLLALFSYVRGNDKMVLSSYDWSPAQFEEIQLHIMSALCTLCPLMIDDYMSCQGNTRILLLIEWCIGSGENLGGTGNTFYGSGSYKTKAAQMQLCIRLLHSVVSSNNDLLLQDLADQGVIHQLSNILADIQTKSDSSMDTEADITLQTDMLHILAVVCEKDVHCKELFGNSGIEMLVKYLKMDLRLLTLGLGYHRLLLAIIDAVWCCVCGCITNEDYFLEKEGAFLLLDLLETCPHEYRNALIGCLMDLMENQKVLSHIMTWHGKENPERGIANLFCHLWRDEERIMGVLRDEKGVIIQKEQLLDEYDAATKLEGPDTKKPLMGTVQSEQGTISLPANAISPAIADVYDNIRSKIFAIFNKIGFIDLPGLTAGDHVTLTIIEHYLDFKIGEVWTEIMAELSLENVRPITPDCEALEVIRRTSSERADHVLNIQKQLLIAQYQQDLQEEQEFYARIRESFRQTEKTMKDFEKYVERTSNYHKLKKAKAQQEEQIEASRVQGKPQEQQFTHHNLEIPNLNTTTFCGRHKAVRNIAPVVSRERTMSQTGSEDYEVDA